MKFSLTAPRPALLIAMLLPISGAGANDAASVAREYRVAHEHEILAEFRQFLRLPNVASKDDDITRNAEWLVDRLAQRGFGAKIWRAGGAPYVYAEKFFEDATRDLLIYAHFDGQPVQAENWASAPWQPTLREGPVEDGHGVVPWESVTGNFDPEWRLYARSAGDDKAPAIALMAALESLQAADIQPTVNIKLILDGEEEIGSPTLGQILAEHSDVLDVDLMLFCDGPMHQSRRRQLVFGVRGSMTVDLTTYGARRPLHSGHYGNWAPNPNDALVRLLAAMKDVDGNITITGYHDGVRPISASERKAIEAIPSIETSLKKELALGRTEGGDSRLEEVVMRPALVLKGLQGGGVGRNARNVIQPSATASLNLRIVPDQAPPDVRKVMETFFRQQGFFVVHDEPGADILSSHPRVLMVDWRPGAYPAFRSRLDGSEATRLITILDSIDGEATLLTPTMGGSLPVYLFEPVVKAPIVLLPIANHDNNQHGRNENLRLGNLWDAIEIYAAVLADFGR